MFTRLLGVRVTVGGQSFEASFIQTGTKRSPHANRMLVVGQVKFRVVDPEQQRQTAAALQSRRRLEAALDGRTQFKVISNSYSSIGHSGPWTHSVELEEAEDLNPSELVIDGLSVKPERYEEHVEEGGITAAAIVRVDSAGRRELENRLKAHTERSYFDVTRVGIEDAARRMRFGRCLWSEHGEVTKYSLFLVDKGTDDAKKEYLDFHPELPNVRRQVVSTRNLVDELLVNLVGSGVLSADARREIEKRAEQNWWPRMWALFKVEDVDETWLG